jgi:hypothetical protein
MAGQNYDEPLCQGKSAHILPDVAFSEFYPLTIFILTPFRGWLVAASASDIHLFVMDFSLISF